VCGIAGSGTDHHDRWRRGRLQCAAATIAGVHTHPDRAELCLPHNLHQRQVTDADITSEREMCEWCNAHLAANHDDYAAPGIQQQADAVTANIDQSEDYRAPRARAFNREEDCDSDNSCTTHIPIFEGQDVVRVWQQQTNISTSTSTKSHNPSGITNI